MKFDKAHQGQYEQKPDGGDEPEARPGIDPNLHAPTVDEPNAWGGRNLHGDVPGSPYSDTPGELSLAEAEQQALAAAAGSQAEDDADTRAREVESRKTGVSTEALAARDEAEDDGSKKPPKPKPPSGKK